MSAKGRYYNLNLVRELAEPLRSLSASERRPITVLIEEAIRDLLAKRGLEAP